MPDATSLSVFLAAALTLAVIPGPGMLYVLARTVRGGRREGVLSTLGTGVAGVFHTLAAALGISAILATSALAFTVVKWLGVAYLVYLGVKTLLERDVFTVEDVQLPRRGALTQGAVTELLNPKTALFFLSFIPQFVNPDGNVFAQFVLLGFVTTLLTSGVDLMVVFAAEPLSNLLKQHRRLQRVQRVASGTTLIGLGVYVAAER